jgi:hypothetical protein
VHAVCWHEVDHLGTTRKVIISNDLLVTLLNLVTEWYVFNDEVLSFVISYERRRFG